MIMKTTHSPLRVGASFVLLLASAGFAGAATIVKTATFAGDASIHTVSDVPSTSFTVPALTKSLDQ